MLDQIDVWGAGGRVPSEGQKDAAGLDSNGHEHIKSILLTVDPP